MSTKNSPKIFLNILAPIVGCFLFAYAFYGLLGPNKVAVGGVGGLATAISSTYGAQKGVLLIAINIPLLLLSWIFLGKKFAINTTLVIIGAGLLLDHVMPYFPLYHHGNQLLSSIFGGCFLGAGIALIFTRGYTTGGTDIIGRLLQLRFPSMSIGKLMMGVDFVIIICAAIIYSLGEGSSNTIESAMYGLITTFVYTKVIDIILSGQNILKVVYIVSQSHLELGIELTKILGQGLTQVPTENVYSNTQGKMIMCVVRNNELTKVKTITKKIDPLALIIIVEAAGVIGNNFKKAS